MSENIPETTQPREYEHRKKETKGEHVGDKNNLFYTVCKLFQLREISTRIEQRRFISNPSKQKKNSVLSAINVR